MMIAHVARKDFLTNLLSARFAIGFILCLVLIPFSILINIGDVRDQMRLYRVEDADAAKSVREVRVYSALRPVVVKPPGPLAVFSRGTGGQVGNRVKIRLGEKPMLAEGRAATRDNPFLGAFFTIDFAGVVAVIFSLLALIFSHDVFTKEREDGTLRLQLSNALSRSRFIAGKLGGIFLTLLPILVFCYLLGAVIILASRGVSFSTVEWGRIALLFGASLLYLAVFVFLGMLVSSRCRTSVTSLVICLFLWVFLVFIVPNLAVYFAQSFVRVQSRDNLTMVMDDLDKEMHRRIEDSEKSLGLSGGGFNWYMSNGDDGYMECYGSAKDLMERYRLENAQAEPIRLDYAEKKWAAQRAYMASLGGQMEAADGMAMVSPAGVFRIVASALCGTDARSHEAFMGETRAYREVFVRYLQGKAIFASFRYFTPTPPEMMLTEDAIVEKRSGGEFKTMKDLEDWSRLQKDGMALFEKISKADIPGTKPSDYPYLDISDMPAFTGQPMRLFAALETLALKIGLMAVECIFLFYLGFVAFIRYDVR